jgi:hypothetical protein
LLSEGILSLPGKLGYEPELKEATVSSQLVLCVRKTSACYIKFLVVSGDLRIPTDSRWVAGMYSRLVEMATVFTAVYPDKKPMS